MGLIPLLELPQNIPELFFVFQDDGKENGFQWVGMSHVNRGGGMEFGPVEQAIKGRPVLFAQALAKLLPPPVLLFQNITEGHNRSAHGFLQAILANRLRDIFGRILRLLII
jgi:hypothetical protein